ncbi:hypothetical protein H8N00_16950 [Streptomyces sp. AC563]|uniref:hypothetical protein n=1 Tax=Streptomyces buecherae TaxID=2763006 RepID=UPI00164DA23B|nr:hypothetical protein [Streptomyces buecherae]MBC3990537.1 hypothetical protein [Streptomyces buecherae]
MRSAIRPVLVVFAVAGFSLAGVASAQAHGHGHGHGHGHHSHGYEHRVHNDNDHVNVRTTDRSYNTKSSTDDSYNGNVLDSYNDSLVLGGNKVS